jgi:hypothetical protein
VAAVLVLGAWFALSVRASGEHEALSGCADEARTAVDRAETRLSATASHIAPSVGVASPRLDVSLLGLVEEQARRVRGPVAGALATCRDVDLWPIGGRRHETRAAYVALLEAEQERLDRISRDGTALFSGYDEIKELAEEAESRLER